MRRAEEWNAKTVKRAIVEDHKINVRISNWNGNITRSWPE